MAQMFTGDPIKCGGTTPRSPDPMSYHNIWGQAWGGITIKRQMNYNQGTNDNIIEAGRDALTAAKARAKTQGKSFGIGVCTTLAAAGLTAIADEMNEDRAKWGGTKIYHMQEAYESDGHEYLFITDENNENVVLVDFWYSALDGSTDHNIVKKKDATYKDRWDLEAAKVAKDRVGKIEWAKAKKGFSVKKKQNTKERIYTVPAAVVSAHLASDYGDAFYIANNGFLMYEGAVDNLLEAQEEFELARQAKSRMLSHPQSRKMKKRRVSRMNQF